MKFPTKEEQEEMERRLEYNPDGCSGCLYLAVAIIAIGLLIINFIMDRDDYYNRRGCEHRMLIILLAAIVVIIIF